MTKFRKSRRRMAIFVASFLLVTGIFVFTPNDIQGFLGGVGDGKFSYGGCSCHIGEAQRGDGTMTLWASTLEADANQEVTVIVNVTETVLTNDKIIGVFLLRAMTGSDSDQPSEDGWRIDSDPNGNENNYVIKNATGLGSPVSFQWVLLAPFRGGTYDLTARAQHGGNLNSWFETGEVLTFSVTGTQLISTNLTLDAPEEVNEDEQFTTSAWLTNEDGDPLEGFQVDFFRITTYGNMYLGSNITDSDGTAYHSDISYDIGIFNIEARFQATSTHAPSNATAEIPTIGEVESEPFLIGGAPAVIVFLVFIILFSVWTTFGFVIYQLVRINKEGKIEEGGNQ
ncbi:MAG: hypothetical protein KAR39_04820 [Thermoplasmata archaeon]|nr:hypothetical protein [Thermoplasmata archaeon]